MSGRLAAGVATGLLAGLLAGCLGGGVREAELSEAPIAFSYRTPEEARRRAEEWIEEREPERPAPRRPQRPGVNDMYATADDVSDYLGRLVGRDARGGEDHPGRLALLDPRTGRVSVIDAARRGSIPLAWSDDHERLLFAQPGDRDYQIYEWNRAERTVRGVTRRPPAHTQGCYADRGRILVVEADPRVDPPRSRIALSGPGGRRPFRPLTEGPADHSPTCAPDGSAVVFVRELGGGRSELRHLDLRQDGAPSRRLSPGQHPVFSRDGEWLVFAAPRGRELRLWRMRPDGSGRAPVGRGMRHEARPALSPDGRVVAYVAAEEPPRRHLYLRRFDGSGDRILFADGDGEFPVW